MKIYIARHGQDDDSVRGGWSDCSLTDLGVKQSVDLADEILSKSDEYNIGMLASVDKGIQNKTTKYGLPTY